MGENNLHISHSYATGAVSGINNTGGLVGSNLSNGVIEYCFALGSVTDIQVSLFNNTGGLVGKNEAGMIRNSYARGLVTLSPSNPGGTDHMAGFVGYNYRGMVENCYSTGRVTHNADDNLGFVALVDTNGAYSMSGNFWDFETSNQPASAGEATGVTTTVMKTQSNFTSAGWDFDHVWTMNDTINDGYPFLRSEALEVNIDNELIPQTTFLNQNYPNPFNPNTTISYQLPVDGKVKLSIYNMNGKKIITLVNDNLSAGYHTVNWDASGFSSGIYFYRLILDNPFASSGKVFIETRKMVLIK